MKIQYANCQSNLTLRLRWEVEFRKDGWICCDRWERIVKAVLTHRL
jgi:hypothetical protein